jgi:hypothetical protein
MTTKAKASKGTRKLTKAEERKSDSLRKRYWAGEFAIPYERWLAFEELAELLCRSTDKFIEFHAPNAHCESELVDGKFVLARPPTEDEIYSAGIYLDLNDWGGVDSRRGLFRGIREFLNRERDKLNKALTLLRVFENSWEKRQAQRLLYEAYCPREKAVLFTSDDRAEVWAWVRNDDNRDKYGEMREVWVVRGDVRFEDRWDTLG